MTEDQATEDQATVKETEETDDDAPADGETATDAGAHAWVACCGTWWGDEVWTKPSARHAFLPAGHQGNCPTCGLSLRRGEPTREDLEEFLGRLRETQAGEWVRVGPVVVGPGESAAIPCTVYERTAVTHLALPADVAIRLRVLRVVINRDVAVEGPLPGVLFAVRVPTDQRYPVDRGGALSRSPSHDGLGDGRARQTFVVYPHGHCVVTVENRSSEPVEVLGALFGEEPVQPRAVVLSAVRDGASTASTNANADEGEPS